MGDPAKRRATYEDLLGLPEHVVGEIIDGELIVQPRPNIAHAEAATVLTADVKGAFDRGRGGPGGWRILFEAELHLGRDVLVPDIAGWRRERVPVLPDAAFIEIAPDWACEVLSPSTAVTDRIKKLRFYAHAEVGHAWLIDPAQRTLEVFRRDGAHWLLVDAFVGDASVRAEPFEAIEIELGALWLPAPVGESP